MNAMTRRVLLVFSSLVVLALAQPGMLTVNQTGDYVTVVGTPDLVPQAGITVEAWFLFDVGAPGGNNNPTIARKFGTYILRVNSGNGGHPQLVLGTPAGWDTLTSNTATPTQVWTHLAGTYDNQTARLYMNGSLILESTIPTGPLNIGSGSLRIAMGIDPSETWKGHIDELRIWSMARSQTEIQATMGQRLDGKPGLVAAWHFDGSFLDHTGGHDGSPTGLIALDPSTSPIPPIELRGPSLVPIGVPTVFEISVAEPLVPYLMEMSLNGQSPGIALPPPAGVLPLNPPLVYGSIGYLFPPIFVDFLGITDVTGSAFPTLVPPLAPQVVGVTLDAAVVTFDPTNPALIGMVSNAVSSVLTAAPPVILGISPETAPVSGNIALTISGTGFQSAASVDVGGVPATNVVVQDASTITCSAPVRPLGPADVHVLNPDGNEDTLAGGLTYIEDLTINAVTPPVAGSGQLVTVSGAGFPIGVQVTAGNISAPVINANQGMVQFVCPSGVPCDTQVVVTAPDSQVASAPFNPSPVITGTFNAIGPAAGGGSFFIFGDHFHAGTSVQVGSSAATIIDSTPQVILATAPPGSSGLASVQVSSINGCSATTTYLYQ